MDEEKGITLGEIIGKIIKARDNSDGFDRLKLALELQKLNKLIMSGCAGVEPIFSGGPISLLAEGVVREVFINYSNVTLGLYKTLDLIANKFTEVGKIGGDISPPPEKRLNINKSPFVNERYYVV